MTIWVDSREKSRAIAKILSEFERQGAEYFISKLPVGDYMSLDNPRLIIDRKQSLLELCLNVGSDHRRFIAEITAAQKYGIRLLFLVEHGGGIKTLSDVARWENPRLKESPKAISGERLFKILTALEAKYGVKFYFCEKRETGERILSLLGEKAG